MNLIAVPTSRGVLAVGLIFGASACARPDPSAADLAVLESQARALAADLEIPVLEGNKGIVVRLAFGEETDLDLYVTDPLLETVYFARHESRTGGVIAADVRCDTTGPRVEEVVFSAPWPGRYRVGVDQPGRCDGARAPAPAAYAVAVNANGKTYRANGVIELERFELVVLEFEVREGGGT